MKIELAKIAQKQEIFNIYNECRIDLIADGIYQWNTSYPTLEIIEDDILREYLHVLFINEEIVGAISISTKGEEQYGNVKWIDETKNFVIIHRLAVKPKYQHLGYGKILMDFAEDLALRKGFYSVRLDAFSGNKRIIKFYEKRGYINCGEIFFPGRNLPFYCYEKLITKQ